MSLIACESLKAVHILHVFLNLEGRILYILNPRDIYRLRPYSIYMSLIILDGAVFDNHICFLRKAPPYPPKSSSNRPLLHGKWKPSQWRHVCFHGRFTHHPRTRTTSTEILRPTLLPSPPAVCLQALSSVSSVPKARACFTFRRRFDRQVLISAKKNKISVKLHLRPADSHTVNFLCVWPFGVIVDGDVESNPRQLRNNQTFQILLLLTLFCMC